MLLHFLEDNSDNRYMSGYFQSPNGDFFLIDCPYLAFMKVKALNLKKYNNIYVVISSICEKQICGLSFLVQYCFDNGKKVTILCPTNIMLSKTEKFLTNQFNPKSLYTLQLINNFKNKFVKFVEIPTEHTSELVLESYGYFITLCDVFSENPKTFTYVGQSKILNPFKEYFEMSSEIYVDVEFNKKSNCLYYFDISDYLIKLANNGIKIYLTNVSNAHIFRPRIRKANIEII